MNLIDSIKLNVYYSNFKDLNVTQDILKRLITDKDFLESYRDNKVLVDNFIKALKTYEYIDYLNMEEVKNGIKHKIDTDTMTAHIEAIIELSKTGSQNKYISNVMNNFNYKDKITNYQIFNYQNIEQLFNIIGRDVFEDNIAEIIKSGHGDRLIEFLQKYPNKIAINDLRDSIFEDKVWDAILRNDTIGNTTLLALMGQSKYHVEKYAEIINDGNYDGFKYTVENIPESHNFIMNCITNKDINSRMFSLDFIKSLGNETMSKLYASNKFYDQYERDKVLKLVAANNAGLVIDGMNFDVDFSFSGIADDDINKDILKVNNYPKKEIFLNKYFGIKRVEITYLRLFLDALSKVALPDTFKYKYNQIYNLLKGIVFDYDDNQLIQLSEQFDACKRDEYKNLINSLEKEGNELIKNEFVTQLKDKNMMLQKNIPHKTNIYKSSDGKEVPIDVYEFTGQPFTMLTHSISNNAMSLNNKYVEEIVQDPSRFANIQEGNNFLSTALISDNHLVTYGRQMDNGTVIYGFSNLPSSVLKETGTNDLGINRDASNSVDFNMRNGLFMPTINTVTTLDDLLEKTVSENQNRIGLKGWNEVILSRSNPETGKKVLPNYIVCMDNLYQSSIDAASYFGIPIYLIQTRNYQQPVEQNDFNLEINNKTI
jgi:hypothetical protein